MTRTTRALGLTALCALGLAGCELIDDVLGAVLDLDNLAVLGVMPAARFADAGSPDAGKVTFAMAGKSGDSIIKPNPDVIEIEDDEGNDIPIEGGDERPGFEQGSFVLLVDGTGSMENSGTGCEGCPTDPDRHRVEAAQALAKALTECGPGWRQSLMEFSTTVTPDAGFEWTRVLSSFDDDVDQLIGASNSMTSDGGTPLWDSTSEVLGSLLDDSVEQFSDKNPDKKDPNEYGIGLVVISDGADTGSSVTLDKLINLAVGAGVPIHTIGLGPASDSVVEFSTEPEAIANLRRLAVETGGYYGYVSDPADLPELTKNIADATCGGYTEVYARFDDTKQSGERVWGNVKLKNTPIKVPFTFTVP